LNSGAPSNKHGLQLGIRGRLTLWFVLGGAAILMLGAYAVYATGLSSIQGTLGQTFCQIASGAAEQFEGQYFQRGTVVENIATDVLTAEVIGEVSSVYSNRSSEWIETRRQRLKEEWKNLTTDQRKSSLHPQLSQRIWIFTQLEPHVLRRISVYDMAGILVASSDPDSARVVYGQSWFTIAQSGKDHFTLIDTDARNGLLTVAVPIWVGVDITGYVVSEIDIKALSQDGEKVRFGNSGESTVVDYAGVPLIGKARAYLIAAMSRQATANVVAPSSGATESSPYWVALPGAGNWGLNERLACIAPLTKINRLRAEFKLPPWSVVVTQAPQESYLALRRSLGFFGVAGIIGIVLLGVVAAVAAHNLSKPLKNLREGVRRFAQGERDRPVTVSSGDEIGELADEFNLMARRVADSENELKAFAKAVEEAADAIIMTDEKRSIYYANPSFVETTGYSVAEVQGGSPSILSTSNTPPEKFKSMEQAIATGRSWRGELWNRRKDGEIYPVDLTISPIHDDKGSIVSYLGIHRDITLRRQYEESLERQVEARTREITRTKGLTQTGRMASMIAHDLRNALSTIKLNLQILSRRFRDTETVETEHCEMALGQVDYMEGVLADMLSYARPDEIRADWINVDAIIDDTVAATQHLADGNGVVIERELQQSLPKIYCDRFKIIGALRNLIENAILAMPEGGKLSIAATLVMTSPHPMVSVSVSDEGGGIPQEIMEEVMEPFFTTRTKGTGLGLAIVQRIVEGHHGKITISSKVGEGTTVELMLPTAPETVDQPTAISHDTKAEGADGSTSHH